MGDILATLDPEAFQRCFVAWAAALIEVPQGVVAVDGKTVRRSKSKTDLPIHMVSAFAARQRLVLGQVKVAEKANEIVAIPKLLDMLDIEGAVVTHDAMGCQRNIAQKIIDKKAAINRYLAEHNQNPSPFTWTADPQRVLNAIGRGRQVLESLH